MDDETKTAFADLRQLIVAVQAENNRQFARIDARFGDIDARIDRLDQKVDAQHEETRRHTGVVVEHLEHKIAALVEGFTFLNDKVDHNKLETDANAEALDVRITRLEATTSRRR